MILSLTLIISPTRCLNLWSTRLLDFLLFKLIQLRCFLRWTGIVRKWENEMKFICDCFWCEIFLALNFLLSCHTPHIELLDKLFKEIGEIRNSFVMLISVRHLVKIYGCDVFQSFLIALILFLNCRFTKEFEVKFMDVISLLFSNFFVLFLSLFYLQSFLFQFETYFSNTTTVFYEVQEINYIRVVLENIVIWWFDSTLWLYHSWSFFLSFFFLSSNF